MKTETPEEKILWVTEKEARFIENVLVQHKQIKSIFDDEFQYNYAMPIQKMRNIIEVFNKEAIPK